MFFSTKTRLNLLGFVAALSLARAEVPDIRSIELDLTIPRLETGQPDAGRRVKQTIPGYEHTGVYHVTYLPVDWVQGKAIRCSSNMPGTNTTEPTVTLAAAGLKAARWVTESRADAASFGYACPTSTLREMTLHSLGGATPKIAPRGRRWITATKPSRGFAKIRRRP